MSLSIYEIQNLASAKGGVLLSPEYKGIQTKHFFRCANGHKWLTTPFAIKHRGAWCPICAAARRSKSRNIYLETKSLMQTTNITFSLAIDQWLAAHPEIQCSRLNIKKRILYYAEKEQDYPFLLKVKKRFVINKTVQQDDIIKK